MNDIAMLSVLRKQKRQILIMLEELKDSDNDVVLNGLQEALSNINEQINEVLKGVKDED